MKTALLRLLLPLTFALASLSVFARPGDAIVDYTPSITIVEGDQPLVRSVTISITSPSNVVPGSIVSISPIATVLNLPAGVTNATALSYVSFNPATLDFTQPNQTLAVTVTMDVPLGSAAGGYAYRIETPGWAPGTVDQWGFLNATIYPQKTGDVPTITLATPLNGDTFTYFPAVGPLSIPFSFTANAPTVTPITTLDANLENGADSTSLAFVSTTNTDGSITGTGTMTITAPGIYTVRARATNDLGTSIDTADITVVVSAPPPTVAIAQPAATTYTMIAGTTFSLPYSFTGTSYYGGITQLTATLNGQPFTFATTGLNTLNATGTGNFALTTGGNYTLVVTATDQNGTATTTRSFSVVSATPAPTITINTPANGSTFTRVAGSPPTQIPFTFTSLANTGFVIEAQTATLNGNPITFTPSGLNTANAGGSATLSLSAPGTYTIVATATSSGVVATASTTFTVTETTPPPASTCGVLWLPPINLNKVQKGGSVLPIKFKLCCDQHACDDDHSDNDHSEDDHCDDDHSEDDHSDNDHADSDHSDGDDDHNDSGEHYGWGRTSDDEIIGKCKGDRDYTVVIAVYEIHSNGSISTPTLFPYDRYSPNPPTYTIQGNNMYHLNFPTAKGSHRYKVEVYRTQTSSTTPQLLDTKEFTTR